MSLISDVWIHELATIAAEIDPPAPAITRSDSEPRYPMNVLEANRFSLLYENGDGPKNQKSLFNATLHLLEIAKLEDNGTKLLAYLKHLYAKATNSKVRAQLAHAIGQVQNRGQGKSLVPDREYFKDIPERIIFNNDMVPFAFLQAGHRAGSSVGRITVPEFDGDQQSLNANGTPKACFGTGWLVTPNHIITNHHVIENRDDDDSATAQELELQATHCVIEFDYDRTNAAASPSHVNKLLACDEHLDYALLELADDSTRKGLAIAQSPVLFDRSNKGALDEDYIPANIIQHPQGGAKMVAFRNNLIAYADDVEVQYLADTEFGSSGSPVFNDRWQIIALHRASREEKGITYMGKPSTYINVGTAISAIFKHLTINHRDVWAEISPLIRFAT